MNLITETLRSSGWVIKVLLAFWAVRPWTTLCIIFAKALSRLTNLLAFFLPLKVILLAGSDGVPRYFRFFIEPDDKEFWIVAFSIGAVGFYMLTMMLNYLVRRMAEAGGIEVLQGANEIAVSSRHRDDVRGYYSQFSGIASSLLIVMLGFTAIGGINYPLAITILSLILAEFSFTALVVRLGNYLEPGRWLRFVKNKTQQYLDILSSVNFLTGFFVLLVPFLIDDTGNLLFAILSILLMRQMFAAIKGMVKNITELWHKRLLIDPLVFRHRKSVRREKAVTLNLRHAFPPGDREDLVANFMAMEGAENLDVKEITSHWQDSPLKGVYTFHILSHSRKAHWLHKVFPKNQLHLLEHEDFLFEHIERRLLKAPKVVARFDNGPFECQVYEYGLGLSVSQSDWMANLPSLFEYYWGLEPPKEVIDAFTTSKSTLEGRLTESYLSRLEVALDTSKAKLAYQKFIERLPEIRKIISNVPLCIHNPDMTKRNSSINQDGEIMVMSWERWSIEHIGVELPKDIERGDLECIVKNVCNKRSFGNDELTVSHVKLVNECRELERLIMQAAYAQALVRIEDVLENGLLAKSLESVDSK